MSSASMSDEDLQETKDHPERFVICPEGNFHRLKGGDFPPEICFCCDGNGHPIYQLSASEVQDGVAHWLHVGFGLLGRKAENVDVRQSHITARSQEGE